jgi:hypothetical protein
MLCRETVRVLYAAQASADRPRARTVGRATGRALCLSAGHAARVQAVVRELMALIQAQTHSVVPSFDFRYEARRAPSMSAAPLERLWALLATRMAAQAHQAHTVLWLGRLVNMSCMGCERWWRRSCTLLR